MVGAQRGSVPPPVRRSGLRQPTRRPALAASDRSHSGSLKAPGSAARPQKSPVTDEISADTSIHVVVRCRGRNEREIQENSGVAVSAEGVKGKTVELSMGPNAVSNKTYGFDKVFSPAASQEIVYEDVVLPIVTEVSSFIGLVQSNHVDARGL